MIRVGSILRGGFMRSNVNETSLWKKVGGGIYQFRFLIIFCLVVCSVFLAIQAKSLPNILGGDGFRTPGEYEKAKGILENEFKQSPNSVIVLLEKKDGATDQQFQADINRVANELNKEKNKKVFLNPMIDPSMKKGNIAYMSFLYDEKNYDKINELNNKLAKRIDAMSSNTVKVSSSGFTIINDVINKTSQNDLKKAELIGIPIAFIVLFFAFGSVIASIIPIVIGMLSILTTFGILTYIGKTVDLSIFVLNVAPMVGLALSIDFALLFVSRYKEELTHSSVKEAIATTYATAGRAIIFSGLCVFIGLSALYFINIDLFRSVAISGAIVVLVSLFFSLSLLPAILSVIGLNINKGRFKKLDKNNDEQHESVWRKFAGFVMKRPVKMICLSLILLLLFVIPLKNVVLNIPTTDALPKNAQARITYEKYQNTFIPDMKNHASVLFVLQSNGDMLQKNNLTNLEQIISQLKKDPKVYKVNSVFDTVNMNAPELSKTLSSPMAGKIQPAVAPFVQHDKTFLQIYLKSKPKSEQGKQWVRDYDSKYKGHLNGFKLTMGGQVKFEQELFDEITNHLRYGLILIICSTFIILMIAFRSLLIPIKAILMNVLSLSATFGIITWLFQGGHFGLPKSDMMLILPVFIFGLVFGLSMDYEVFLMSRMQELYEETGDNEYSTREGLVSTSRIITSAASIMIVITGAFAFTDLVPVKQMGIGIAVAIFLDATIIRLILVPSLMQLFGKWNWWLPFVKRKTMEPQEKVS
jgi:RND superfamily putative drug exporter